MTSTQNNSALARNPNKEAMMVQDNYAFFGAVLKAIACTRNHNQDINEYAAGVLAPATQIRELEQEVGTRLLTGDEVKQVLDWLEQTFDTKRTPQEEREHYLRLVNEVGGIAIVEAAA